MQIRTLMGIHPVVVGEVEHLGTHALAKRGDDGQRLPVSSY